MRVAGHQDVARLWAALVLIGRAGLAICLQEHHERRSVNRTAKALSYRAGIISKHLAILTIRHWLQERLSL
jgi:hypothetical protein